MNEQLDTPPPLQYTPGASKSLKEGDITMVIPIDREYLEYLTPL